MSRPPDLGEIEQVHAAHINNIFTKLDPYPAEDDNGLALFHGRNDRYDQDCYGEHEQDEMRAIKIVSYSLGSALPA